MKTVSSDQMRELDRRTIESGTSGRELMLRAGKGLATSLRRLASEHQLVDAPVLFIAGCGNNGGDAFVAAHALFEEEWDVACWLAGPEEKLRGDAAHFFRKMVKAGVPLQGMNDSKLWEAAAEQGTEAELIIDALLGTGVSGEPRGVIADALHFIEHQADRSLVVSVDVPSAMAVSADLTVTMGCPKTECLQPEYVDRVGVLEVVDIGIPPAYVDEVKSDSEVELIHPSDLAPLFPRRHRDTHKGSFGHLLCIGGSKGFSGAISMAARAALRSGSGLVSAWVPEAVHMHVAVSAPEIMVHSSMPEGEWSAILAGPGMGRSMTTQEQVLQLLETSKTPLILDADAITQLAGKTDAIRNTACPVVLTPHPGELAALLGVKTDEVQEDRWVMARMAADRLNAVVVLKGAGTVVAAPDQLLAVNMTGNPGMASGGSGDVLAGIIAGLIAQGIAPFAAACSAVWLHGRVGDLAAAEKSQASLIATDLIDFLPNALREVSCR